MKLFFPTINSATKLTLLATLILTVSFLTQAIVRPASAERAPIELQSESTMNIFSFNSCSLFVKDSTLKLLATFDSEPKNEEIERLTTLLKSWAKADTQTPIYAAMAVEDEIKTLSLTSDPGSWQREDGISSTISAKAGSVYQIEHSGLNSEDIKKMLEDFIQAIEPRAKIEFQKSVNSNSSTFSLVLPYH